METGSFWNRQLKKIVEQRQDDNVFISRLLHVSAGYIKVDVFISAQASFLIKAKCVSSSLPENFDEYLLTLDKQYVQESLKHSSGIRRSARTTSVIEELYSFNEVVSSLSIILNGQIPTSIIKGTHDIIRNFQKLFGDRQEYRDIIDVTFSRGLIGFVIRSYSPCPSSDASQYTFAVKSQMIGTHSIRSIMRGTMMHENCFGDAKHIILDLDPVTEKYTYQMFQDVVQRAQEDASLAELPGDESTDHLIIARTSPGNNSDIVSQYLYVLTLNLLRNIPSNSLILKNISSTRKDSALERQVLIAIKSSNKNNIAFYMTHPTRIVRTYEFGQKLYEKSTKKVLSLHCYDLPILKVTNIANNKLVWMTIVSMCGNVPSKAYQRKKASQIYQNVHDEKFEIYDNNNNLNDVQQISVRPLEIANIVDNNNNNDNNRKNTSLELTQNEKVWIGNIQSHNWRAMGLQFQESSKIKRSKFKYNDASKGILTGTTAMYLWPHFAYRFKATKITEKQFGKYVNHHKIDNNNNNNNDDVEMANIVEIDNNNLNDVRPLEIANIVNNNNHGNNRKNTQALELTQKEKAWIANSHSHNWTAMGLQFQESPKIKRSKFKYNDESKGILTGATAMYLWPHFLYRFKATNITQQEFGVFINHHKIDNNNDDDVEMANIVEIDNNNNNNLNGNYRLELTQKEKVWIENSQSHNWSAMGLLFQESSKIKRSKFKYNDASKGMLTGATAMYLWPHFTYRFKATKITEKQFGKFINNK
jgi:hypothetical protein